MIKLDDPATWPEHEDLAYLVHQFGIAHAFHRRHESLCGSLNLQDLPFAEIPSETLGRLCMHCHRQLYEQGYA